MATTQSYTVSRVVAALITGLVVTVALSSVAGTQGGAQAPATGAAAGQAGRGAPQPAGRAGGPGLADPVNVGGDYGPKPPVLALSPEEQAKRFILPPGYRLELVLSDPDIVSPAAMAFDGNGRLYVAELRSYMLDVDAGRQHEPTSRISMHESTKGDGVFDKHTRLRRQPALSAHDPAARQGHPHERDALGRRAAADRHERRRRRGQAAGVLHGRRRRPQRQRAAGAERLRLGRSTTGSTAPTTPSASAGRRAASSASPPALRAPSGACRWTTTARSGW